MFFLIFARLAAERFHRREKERVEEELVRITTKLPAARRIHDFRNKFLYGDPEAKRRKARKLSKKRGANKVKSIFLRVRINENCNIFSTITFFNILANIPVLTDYLSRIIFFIFFFSNFVNS